MQGNDNVLRTAMKFYAEGRKERRPKYVEDEKKLVRLTKEKTINGGIRKKIHCVSTTITTTITITPTSIFERSSTLIIGVERVNQEKHLVEYAGYMTLAATNSEECDVVWGNRFSVFFHATPLYF